MQKHKLHPKAIDIIINIYKNEKTVLTKENEFLDDIEITSGIKQGCNSSGTLFLLITYLIIDELNKMKIGFKTKQLKINNLFFADDGILIAETVQETAALIQKLKEIGHECGLEINNNKSSIYMTKNQENIKEISNIQVVKEFKYLGVTINQGKDIFKNHKIKKIRKSKQLSNMILSVIQRSTNKFLIGKTYWKNVVLPEILYSSEIITFTQDEIKQLQTAENQAYKMILSAPRYTANEILRSEIGSSTMETRDKTNKIIYLKHLIETENEMINRIIEHDLENSITPFSQKLNKFLNELNINLEYIRTNNNIKIKEKIKSIDTEKWRNEAKNKKTLEMYLRFKNEIKEEKDIYDNTEESRILFKARSNTLKLNWRNKYNKDNSTINTKCPLCTTYEETLEHFLTKCVKLKQIREKMKNINNENEMLRRLLCFEKTTWKIEEGKKILLEMWKERMKKEQIN